MEFVGASQGGLWGILIVVVVWACHMVGGFFGRSLIGDSLDALCRLCCYIVGVEFPVQCIGLFE